MQNLTVLPLHGGKAPRWLFSRMVRLGALISGVMIDEYGTSGLMDRLTDPMWFQALACAIGYDWHSSGTTTVVVGALKEALNYNSDIFIAGGKGKQGTSTPEQIMKGVDHLSIPGCNDEFAHYSRMAAKIDSALIYDNLGIYHHAFLFSKGRDWAVIQQGMHGKSNMAVRFQISGKTVDTKDITRETNTAVASGFSESTMDLTFGKNDGAKQLSLRLVNEDFREIENMKKAYVLPERHEIIDTDISKKAVELLKTANDLQLDSYEKLMSIKGIGRKTLAISGDNIVADIRQRGVQARSDNVFLQPGREGRHTIPDKPEGLRRCRFGNVRDSQIDKSRRHREGAHTEGSK